MIHCGATQITSLPSEASGLSGAGCHPSAARDGRCLGRVDVSRARPVADRMPLRAGDLDARRNRRRHIGRRAARPPDQGRLRA